MKLDTSAGPFTSVIRQALQQAGDTRVEADLLFLEAWEMFPSAHLGAALRAGQIRRANPELAAALDREIKTIHAPRRRARAA